MIRLPCGPSQLATSERRANVGILAKCFRRRRRRDLQACRNCPDSACFCLRSEPRRPARRSWRSALVRWISKRETHCSADSGGLAMFQDALRRACAPRTAFVCASCAIPARPTQCQTAVTGTNVRLAPTTELPRLSTRTSGGDHRCKHRTASTWFSSWAHQPMR